MEKKEKSLVQKMFDTSDIDNFVKVYSDKVGSQGFDAWGFNLRKIRESLRFVKVLYENYFRVEVSGWENIPADGRCLIIPNHSGQLPIDGLMVGYALIVNPVSPRAPKAMIERFFSTVPFVGNWLNSVGAVLGDTINCERMLDNDEVVVVFPEGVRGSGKTYDKRYQLQRFGNGFMHLAMKHNAPIIPVGIVGLEESIISVSNIKFLANFFAIPYAPLILPAVLPSKVFIHFGKPMHFKNNVHTEHKIKERVDEVKNEINKLINKGLSARTSIFQK